MTRWRAVVPLNWGGEGKSRLADLLASDQRRALVLAMARHVIAVLRATEAVESVAVLAPSPPPLACGWLADQGTGLNAELVPHLAQTPVLAIHADLPQLTPDDVRALLAAAERAGAALAGDHAGGGTNAIALARPVAFVPAFGPDSLARHRALLPHAALVARQGLAEDLDTPADHARLRHRLPDMLGGIPRLD